MKFPKQWRRWMYKARIVPESSRTAWTRGQQLNIKHLRGRDRIWRVTADGKFECSCPIEYFDRFANSHGAYWHRIPRTEAEFVEAVKSMVQESRDAR